jgi:hypothetical protein
MFLGIRSYWKIERLQEEKIHNKSQFGEPIDLKDEGSSQYVISFILSLSVKLKKNSCTDGLCQPSDYAFFTGTSYEDMITNVAIDPAQMFFKTEGNHQ